MAPQASQTIKTKSSEGTTVPLDAAHQFTSIPVLQSIRGGLAAIL